MLWAVGANPRAVARKMSSGELTGVGGATLLKEVRTLPGHVSSGILNSEWGLRLKPYKSLWPHEDSLGSPPSH